MSRLGNTPGTTHAADSNGISQSVEAVKDEMVEVESEGWEDDSAAEPSTAEESQSNDADPADESQSNDAALGSAGESQSNDADPGSADPNLVASGG